MLSLVLKYGLILFVALSLFKLLEFQFWGRNLTLEMYLALVATAFLAIGFFLSKVFSNKPASSNHSASEQADPELLAQFSPREKQVLLLLGHGYTNKEIALSLEISPNTVKTHIKKVFEKLGVSNRTQAVSEAKLLKIIE